ncbi:Uu.00g020420.m01.CDS01 [Anthostomella pinea]|uniref:Uu.00g020420.m01.CDS01 n=1 Tax=Anthostomella pinea TaxID=933095 RepID=A0AAI8YQR9_9PEZI|nr:Uu.00g020420.m01.CDS01 [Anthostomella pinea]
MSPRYDEAPEVAPHNYPEVHYPPAAPEVAAYNQHQTQPQPQPHQYPQHNYHTPPAVTPIKPSPDSATIHSAAYTPRAAHPAPSTTTGYDNRSAYGTLPSERGAKMSKRVCGCPVLVFVLSVIIALLSAAVIGLAAGTGIEASRANTAEMKLASANTSGSATPTSTASSPTATASNFNAIDRNCSTDSDSVTGTTYTSQFYGKPTFKVYCNSDTPNGPLASLFVGNFDDCIDACASWSSYVPGDFPDNSTSINATCSGVSFIPAWTNRTFAVEGSAPGNCYLKPGPQSTNKLTTPNIGSEVHGAILQTGS